MKETKEQSFHRIASGIKAWRESTETAALLISEAKETEIWKLKYASFKEFCEKECGITDRWGRALAQTANTIREIEDAQERNPVPPSEATSLANPKTLTAKTAAPLRGLPAEKKAEAFQAATDASGGEAPTVAAIKTAVRKVIDAEEIHHDKIGRVIPAKVLATWQRAAETAAELMRMSSAVKCAFKNAEAESDMVFCEVSLQSVQTAMGSVYLNCKLLQPHCVCPTCQGLNPDKCTLCKGRGFISEFRWDRQVSEQTRNIVLKSIERGAR